MTKQYDAQDFEQIMKDHSNFLETVRFSNDEVPRIYRKQSPLKQRARYLEKYSSSTSANEDPVQQEIRTKRLQQKLQMVEGFRSQLSEGEYQQLKNHLHKEMQENCRIPERAKSPSREQLRKKLDRAFGGDCER